MATAQILIHDSEDRTELTGEIRTSDVEDKTSPANLLAAWLGTNWDELLLLFRAQLTADHQERTGQQPVAASTPGPKLLDGQGNVISGDDGLQTEPQLDLPFGGNTDGRV